MYRFSNNAVGTLAVALEPAGAMLEVGVGEGALFNPVQPYDTQDGSVQLVTLTHPTLPGIYEIVALVQGTGFEADVFVVERAREETAARAWPPGTQVSARITAKMMKSMLQNEGIDSEGATVEVKTGGSANFTLNGRVGDGYNRVQMSGWHCLQGVRAVAGNKPDIQDMNMSRESFGASHWVNAGVVPAFSSRAYFDKVIVTPSTPNGFQYLFETADGFAGGSINVATEPAFDVFGDTLDVLDGDGQTIAHWVACASPIDLALSLHQGGRLMVSEVGFICLGDQPFAVPPTVSIGTHENPSLYASSVLLTSITGQDTCHRFPVSAGGPLVGGLRFKVDVPSDGECIGRFYWRGQMIEQI